MITSCVTERLLCLLLRSELYVALAYHAGPLHKCGYLERAETLEKKICYVFARKLGTANRDRASAPSSLDPVVVAPGGFDDLTDGPLALGRRPR